MNYFYFYFYKYKNFFILLIFFVFLIFIFFNFCFFDSSLVYKYDQNLLSNKEVWKHVYGSIGSVASPIVIYNNKYKLDSFSDFINHFSVLKSLLHDHILNSNNSVFFKSPQNNPEVDIIYQNYMNDMVNLQKQVKTVRSLVYQQNFDLRVFNNLLKFTFDKYIIYLNSALKVIELDPNSSKPEIINLIGEINSLIIKLNELKKL